MLKISDSVRNILEKDAKTLEVMEEGLLNLSAYAKKILPQVKKTTKKPVTLGSIIIALSRLSGKMESKKDFRPTVKIDSFSIKSGLYELTFPHTPETFRETAKAVHSAPANSFLAVTTGIREITLICQSEMVERIRKSVSTKPGFEMGNLVGITVNFSDSYMEVPNAIYSLVSMLAVRKINLIEIVSTYTELTFVIKKQEMKDAIAALEES